ncbi:MAG: class I SAM-dependent methyltransferase [Gemmatimonadetes bacterium]|nr:class I SAM-dependent methyltransferase [Gemmatimonadota bacterium]MBT6144636.1 class I SAM-dependent methyltransferase [Gemmatimonadota bacterium]MBT7863930.1 class I SAM-dependent methyltransferase [Gemmatimonadota bacterium]
MGSEIQAYYRRGREATRCQGGSGLLEFARIQELVRRYLPPAPAIVLDVGGGPATHAGWLAADGYEVHLIDPVEELLEDARTVSAAQPQAPIASIRMGEARQLPHADGSVDAVLLFGPLYHLTQRQARIEALLEAGRVVRPGGVILAIGISRFASALDGLLRRFVDDEAFIEMMERDLDQGQHRRPAHRATYFTTAFFHHPDELASEATDAGLEALTTLAIQGPAWLLGDFDERWADEAHRERILDVLRRIEAETSMLGASGHLMLVARRPA